MAPALAFVSIAAAASIVNIHSMVSIYESPSLGTTTADASGSPNFAGAGLPDGAHSFAASDMDSAGNTRAASRSVNRTVAPSITSFSTTPNNVFDIGGDAYRVETAGKSYNRNSPAGNPDSGKKTTCS
jgi:hypothetical protein